jgi:hypothetical protein
MKSTRFRKARNPACKEAGKFRLFSVLPHQKEGRFLFAQSKVEDRILRNGTPVDTAQPLLYNPVMSISPLLIHMCATLSEADLNAIRKARGFSVRETASRDSFASFFVSSIGVQEVMQQLTSEESIALQLLYRLGEVDISFFERLYGSAVQPGMPYYTTFTQQFKPTLDAVKKNLVRKGLLIMAEIKLPGESVQMERWRFTLPPEFAPYLPPVLQTRRIDSPGETSERIVRKKILQLVGGEPAVPHGPLPIHIHQGSIQLGEQPFTVNSLVEWQTLAWQNALAISKPIPAAFLAPIDAIRTLLAELEPGRWADAKSIEPILKIYCYGGGKNPFAEKILQLGWELGALSRQKIDAGLYYRFAPALAQTNPDNLPPSIPWLQVSAKMDAIKVDLRLIPFAQLEQLNLLMDLTVEDGALLALPNLIKLGRSLPAQRQSPLAGWLAENIPTFREDLAVVNERWGRTLLHTNLLVAQVRDLSLRIQLERELGQKIVVLSEHFVAFSNESRPIIEKVLKKSGFVIKTVKT